MELGKLFSLAQRLRPEFDKCVSHLECIKSLKIQTCTKKKKVFQYRLEKQRCMLEMQWKGGLSFGSVYRLESFKEISKCPSFKRVRKPFALTLLFFDICQVSRPEG